MQERELPYELDLNYDIKTMSQLNRRLKQLPDEIKFLQAELEYLTMWKNKLDNKPKIK